jgi:hypothetical protein
MSVLQYKANAPAVCDRLRQLVGRKANDRIFAAFFPPSKTMKSFQKKYSGFTQYPDPRERILFWDSMFQERISLDDDNIPAAYPSEFDQGLYGGLLGGDVRFLATTDDGYVGSGWISSMVPHLLKNWSGFDDLKFSENHFWYERFITQLGIMKETASGKFGISHLIAIDSINFVYELVGATDTYLSMYEVPELVRRAIDFGFNLNLKIHSTFFDIVKTLDGGTCSWVIPWIPGRIVNESIDPFHMTSVDDFEKWGREPAERLMSKFDGGVLHLHANGWHLLEAACTMKGIRAILMVNEKDHVPALPQIQELRKRAGDMPLSIYVSYSEFAEAIQRHELAGGVFHYVSGVPDIDSANRCMEKVRSYRV